MPFPALRISLQLTYTTVTDRLFLAESRIILARIVYAFKLSLVDPEDKDWPNNRAYLAYEPKALMIMLHERNSSE